MCLKGMTTEEDRLLLVPSLQLWSGLGQSQSLVPLFPSGKWWVTVSPHSPLPSTFYTSSFISFCTPYVNVSPQPKHPEKSIWIPKLSSPLPHWALTLCPHLAYPVDQASPGVPVGLRHGHTVPNSWGSRSLHHLSCANPE